MTTSDHTPVSPSQLDNEGKLIRRGLSALTLIGSAYLLGVSGFRYAVAAICSTGGCIDDGLYGGGWENRTVAVLVILATIALWMVARSRGRGSVVNSAIVVAWIASIAVVLFALSFFV